MPKRVQTSWRTVRSRTVLRVILLTIRFIVYVYVGIRFHVSCFMFHVRGRPTLAPFTSLQVWIDIVYSLPLHVAL